MQADRARSTLSAMFGWCVGEGILEANPVVGTNKQSKAKSRDRVLTDDELVAVWTAAPASDFGRIVKLLMLTGQRRDEIADLQRAEIEDDVLALPAERTKNSRPHDVPLSPQALAVLDDQPERVGREYVFGDGEGGFTGFSSAKERLDDACGVADWTLHDLRRTMATRMADLGVQPHVIEAILNHVSGPQGGRGRRLQPVDLRRGKARCSRSVGRPRREAACCGGGSERHGVETSLRSSTWPMNWI